MFYLCVHVLCFILIGGICSCCVSYDLKVLKVRGTEVMGKRASSKKAQPKMVANKTKKVIADTDSRHQIEETMAPKRRALKTRNTEDAATRAIEEKFKGVPAHILQSKPCKCGKLLHTKIVDDLRKARQVRKRLGANYWRELQMWFSASAPLEQIEVSKDEEVSPKLLASLRRAASTVMSERTAEPVQAYLSSCEQINGREVVGILKLCTAPKRLSRSDRDVILIALLRCLDRLGPEVLHKHMEALKASKEMVDETLAAMYSSAQKGRVKASTWIQVLGHTTSIYSSQSEKNAPTGLGLEA